MLLEWWERYRRLILAIGTLLFAGSSIWLYRADQPSLASGLPLETPAYAAATNFHEAQMTKGTREQHESNRKDMRQPEAAEKKAMDSPVSLLYVDVKGKVKQPGLYRLEAGMRVADAIAKAGGSLPDADLEQINLAQPLIDGSAIVIPSKGTLPAVNGLPPGSSSAVSSRSPVSSVLPSHAADPQVNLNTASKEELMTLPGVGESRAEAIISYRTEKGAFRSPEELKEVEGIGDKMYERMKARIRTQ